MNNHRQLLLAGPRFLGLLLLVGCGSPELNAPLNESLARQSFVQFMETWKNGGSPESLRNGIPAIIVGEPEWESGSQLTDYQLISDKEQSDGVNAHTTVLLSLKSSKGRRSRMEVTYIVGTSPVITIHRK